MSQLRVIVGAWETIVEIPQPAGAGIQKTGYEPAGVELCLDLVQYLKSERQILISRLYAFHLLIEFAHNKFEGVSVYREIGGRDIRTGLPAKIRLINDEVNQAIEGNLRTIITLISNIVNFGSVEISSVILSGDLRHLSGLASGIAQATGLEVLIED